MMDFIWIELTGAAISAAFLVYLWWRDPYRHKAKQIMDKCKRKTDVPPIHFNNHHHSH